MTERTIHMLVVGDDRSLESEVQSAAEALRRTRLVVQFVEGFRAGAETARNKAPDLIVVQLTEDPEEVRTFAEDVEVTSPESVIIGAYRADALSDRESEAPVLINALRCRVRDFVRRPVSSTELQEVIDRNVRSPVAPMRRGRANGRIISFVSNKGGVGKSTMSVSAACVLARKHPGRVLLVDASLQLGVCASSFDLEPETTIVDAVQELGRLDETLLRQIAMKHRSGLHVLAAPNDAVEATHVGEAEISRILSVARRTFDYVIVDTFPLLDAVAVAILDLSQMVYVVTSGTVPNVIGMAKFIDVIERLGVGRDRQRLILNHAQPRFQGSLTPADVATRLNRDIDHVFPFEKRVLVSLNTGDPYALNAGRRFGYGKALKLLEADLESVAAPRALQGAPRAATQAEPPPQTVSLATGEVRA